MVYHTTAGALAGSVAQAAQALGDHAQAGNAALVLTDAIAHAFDDLRGLLGRARLVALRLVQLADHARDIFHRARNVPAALGLLLLAALDLLRDDAHLFGAGHDELGTTRLLCRGRSDLLHR